VSAQWKGLYGSTQTFSNGSSATVDDAFLKTEIEDPQARIVKGFGPVMPKLPVTDADVVALSAYIRSLGAGAGPRRPANSGPAHSQKSRAKDGLCR
jgi:cytochrome c oxidase subunit 2